MTTVDTAADGTVRDVTDDSFAAEVLRARLPVLVEFTAEWCPPCRRMEPVLAALAGEQRDRLRVVRIDVDENPATTLRYGVLSAPTLMVFRDGEAVASWVGARSGWRLAQDLAGVL
ncbi:thioredoxin family protein [Planosporangium sp. 12N6]|uniref:thioredoxin family protein n=1 Tax=Planosporangium spinosum TaxID=3402278 RepID=UPI003CF7790C